MNSTRPASSITHLPNHPPFYSEGWRPGPTQVSLHGTSSTQLYVRKPSCWETIRSMAWLSFHM